MSEKKSFPRRLFGGLWTLVAGVYKALMILSFLIFLFVLWSLFSGGPGKKIEDNVALVLWPSGQLVDQRSSSPGQRLMEQLSGDPPSETLLSDLTDALEVAADDPRIPLAVIRLDRLGGAGLPQLEELAVAMKKFEAKGKTIHAYGPEFSQGTYLAAAQSSDISMDPMGSVMLEGFSSYGNYFKDGLDKLGVNVHVFRVGEYKSAVEPFLRNDMSADAKAANLDWLGDLWGRYTQTLAASRKLENGAVDRYVSSYRQQLEAAQGDSAKVALDAKLVDHLETLTQFRARIAKTVGEDKDAGTFRQIAYTDYLHATDGENRKQEHAGQRKLALVSVQGEIVDGLGDSGQAGADTIVELLNDARRDKDIAAVVLRVDSPGGSVWGSEQIRRAVNELKAAKKPVVASMSSVAASGGYWISMDADQIWAHESTITGSIGIFGMIPTLEKPLEKLGIHTDGVGTTPLAGALRIDRPLSADVSAIIQAQINKGYRDFIGGVAKGRKLPVEKVDELARGRVWSGQDAKQLGLIDSFGGLEQAASAAAALAGLKDGQWQLISAEPPRHGFADYLGGFFGSIRISLNVLPHGAQLRLAQWLQGTSQLQRAMSFVGTDPKGMYAHCLCTVQLGGDGR